MKKMTIIGDFNTEKHEEHYEFSGPLGKGRGTGYMPVTASQQSNSLVGVILVAILVVAILVVTIIVVAFAASKRAPQQAAQQLPQVEQYAAVEEMQPGSTYESTQTLRFPESHGWYHAEGTTYYGDGSSEPFVKSYSW